ncbi:MAG: hypothetical protein QNJ35_16205 [Paracoccaceae bacterium]|nr:hypothetical protein [Paracoccaceae bacterium]
MKMLRTAIAGLTAAALLAAPVQAQSRSSSDDVAKIIAGIAALAIIAKAVDDRNDRKVASSDPNRWRFGSVDRRDRVIDGRIRRYHDDDDDRRRTNYKRRPLPRDCLVVVETRRGDRLAYGQRCVNRNYRYASRLPNQCKVTVNTRRGTRAVYGARCLNRDGWRVASR